MDIYINVQIVFVELNFQRNDSIHMACFRELSNKPKQTIYKNLQRKIALN